MPHGLIHNVNRGSRPVLLVSSVRAVGVYVCTSNRSPVFRVRERQRKRVMRFCDLITDFWEFHTTKTDSSTWHLDDNFNISNVDRNWDHQHGRVDISFIGTQQYDMNHVRQIAITNISSLALSLTLSICFILCAQNILDLDARNYNDLCITKWQNSNLMRERETGEEGWREQKSGA